MSNVAAGSAAIAAGLAAALLGVAVSALSLAGQGPRWGRAARQLTYMMGAAAVAGVVVMERALITRDFGVKFVADNGSSTTPAIFNVATLWSALEGSILLWALVLCGYTVAVAVRFRRRGSDPMVAWALLVMFAVSAFFFALMVGPGRPLHRGRGARGLRRARPQPAAAEPHPHGVPPSDPLPRLRGFHRALRLRGGRAGHRAPWGGLAGVHPALDRGRLGLFDLRDRARGLVELRDAGLGRVLGLGPGGERLAVLPWLTGTAYLHSVMVQERRGMLRVWNLSLVIATFSLTILGTFLTRSGVLASVHSFTESGIGPAILGFFAVIVAVSLALIAWRGNLLRTPGRIVAPVSREGAFLANNALFAAFAFVVLLGTVFPLLVEAFDGRTISVGNPYFDRMTRPIGFALLFLMAVAPMLPWGGASRRVPNELLGRRLLVPVWIAAAVLVLAVLGGARGWAPLLAFGLGGFAGGAALRQTVLAVRRHRWRGLAGRTNGGMIVHLGVVLVAVAFAASQSYVRQAEFDLEANQQASFAGHEVVYLGSAVVVHENRTERVAFVRVDDAKTYGPAIATYPFASQTIGIPSVRSTLRDDVALAVLSFPDSAGPDRVILRVTVQPLVAWLWLGGIVMAAGTVLSLVPAGSGRRREPGKAAVAAEPVP